MEFIPQESKIEIDKLTFMQEVERDAVRRTEERKQREAIAQNLRKYLLIRAMNVLDRD